VAKGTCTARVKYLGFYWAFKLLKPTGKRASLIVNDHHYNTINSDAYQPNKLTIIFLRQRQQTKEQPGCNLR
jgi:hypothetical protein